MKKRDLIQAILLEADSCPRATAEHVVDPLRRFGQVWLAGGHWWFSEQRAEVSTYTANGGASSIFGEGQFEVKQLTQEDYERAKQSWETYGGRL